MAVDNLHKKGEEVIAIGQRLGNIGEVEIIQKFVYDDFDTVTLYLNPELHRFYINYILDVKPKRVIFNPGTENPEFEKLLEERGIKAERACTLVLLSTNQY
jgi:predicted CoA-binding protein